MSLYSLSAKYMSNNDAGLVSGSPTASLSAPFLQRLSRFDGIPPSNNRSTVEETRRQLEEQVTILAKLTACFIQRINGLAPIFRLPPEILIDIFHIVCSYPIPGYRIDVCDVHNDRVSVTHTCRRWRAIALSTPTLWQHVDFAVGSKWAEVMFQRTGSIPVSIHLKPLLDGAQSCSLMLNHVPRAKELDIAQRITSRREATHTRLTMPAPILERFRFTAPPEQPMPSLPPDLFAGCAPRLRFLELSNVLHGLWMSPILKNVAQLSLSFPPELPRSPTSLHVVLYALQQMSVLENLTLRHSIPNSARRPLPSAVDLPHLKQLTILEHVDACTHFLQHIRFPPTVQLDFDVYSLQADGIAMLLSALAPHLGAEHTGFSSIKLLFSSKDHIGQHTVNVEAWCGGAPTLSANTESSPPADLKLCIRLTLHGTPFDAAVLQHIFAVLQADRAALRVLDVFALASWPSTYWEILLPFARGVHTIRAGGLAVLSLCQELAMPGPALRSHDGQMLCPKLASLTLTRGRFWEELRSEPLLRDLMWVPLLAWLTARRIGNVPVPTVCLMAFEIGLELSQEWKALVPGLSIITFPV